MGQLIKFPQAPKRRKDFEIRAREPKNGKTEICAKVLFFTGVRYERSIASLPSVRLATPFARV